MPDTFSAFIAGPTGETFLNLRADLLATLGSGAGADDLQILDELIEAGDFVAVPSAFNDLMPAWLLSPRAHRLAAYAAAQSGDADRAALERSFARACMKGLLESGDGTRARPYRVVHVTDEYDLMEALGHTVRQHRQVVGSDGSFDLLASDQGIEVWFALPVARA